MVLRCYKLVKSVLAKYLDTMSLNEIGKDLNFTFRATTCIRASTPVYVFVQSYAFQIDLKNHFQTCSHQRFDVEVSKDPSGSGQKMIVTFVWHLLCP